MKYTFTIFLGLLVVIAAYGQRNITNNITPPNVPQIRTMAEWEEIEALIVTWTTYQPTLAEIVKHAKKECKVYIVCDNAQQTKAELGLYNVDTINIEFIEDDYNSVWIRDYGATSIYANHIDSLFLVDWIYNRNRPHDDTIPRVISRKVGVPLYSTTSSPYDLVNTGGNFMSDGMGTAFSSKLILEENGPLGNYNPSIKTEQEIDSIMKEFMGIDRYIKMDILPYDGIHHIDMHMKLLNEETLLVGEYPPGVADGPIIEANLQYILNNFQSAYGTPFRVVRIPMPPDECGRYPDQFSSCNGSLSNWGYYRTYTNLVFVNNTVLVPTYDPQYDTIAFNILKKELPGYKIVGIDCNYPIKKRGALHCITRAVGAKDQLYINHQAIRAANTTNIGYTVNATIRHKSGIQSAIVYYSTDTALGYIPIPMQPASNDTWTAVMPAQNNGTEVFYFIKAIANNGKIQLRPMPAPKGYWRFEINTSSRTSNLHSLESVEIFPNPSFDFVNIGFNTRQVFEGKISLINVVGQEIDVIYNGYLSVGKHHFQHNVSTLNAGTYFIRFENNGHIKSSKLVVQR